MYFLEFPFDPVSVFGSGSIMIVLWRQTRKPSSSLTLFFDQQHSEAQKMYEMMISRIFPSFFHIANLALPILPNSSIFARGDD